MRMVEIGPGLFMNPGPGNLMFVQHAPNGQVILSLSNPVYLPQLNVWNFPTLVSNMPINEVIAGVNNGLCAL